ncbi:hypothetical protein [Sporosarcina highlanderae]|uniref:Uncharacterized protein n=1 Tax=Sporosarcina highlanderae TaxID=3035916 RepID=A0ABT8JV30_9BACL|nr:hypothetical protein [Sporosarcina highlanderae]MDN4608638.1 hypothetical protein [Sporosarcina highlanderae]
MQEIQIQRRQGPYSSTRVIVTRDGMDFVFFAGRHVGERRIYELAQTLEGKL